MEVAYCVEGSPTFTYTPKDPGIYKFTAERDGQLLTDFPVSIMVQRDLKTSCLVALYKIIPALEDQALDYKDQPGVDVMNLQATADPEPTTTDVQHDISTTELIGAIPMLTQNLQATADPEPTTTNVQHDISTTELIGAIPMLTQNLQATADPEPTTTNVQHDISTTELIGAIPMLTQNNQNVQTIVIYENQSQEPEVEIIQDDQSIGQVMTEQHCNELVDPMLNVNILLEGDETHRDESFTPMDMVNAVPRLPETDQSLENQDKQGSQELTIKDDEVDMDDDIQKPLIVDCPVQPPTEESASLKSSELLSSNAKSCAKRMKTRQKTQNAHQLDVEPSTEKQKEGKDHTIVREEKNYSYCEGCELGFKDLKQMNEHFKARHSRECGMKYSVTTEIENTEKEASSPEHMPCEVTKTAKGLDNNDNNAAEDSAEIEECDKDMRNSSSKTLIVVSNYDNLQCDVAKKEILVNDISVDIKKCDICGKHFHSEMIFQKHMKLNHPEHMNDLLPDCDTKCPDSEPTSPNKAQESSESQLPYKCPECDRGFSAKRYMRQHLKRIHTQRHATFDCEQCGKVFNYKANLQKHLKIHAKSPKEKAPRKTDHRRPLICPKCGKTLNSSQSLAVHIKRIHDIQTRDFNCESCEKSFKLQSDLTRHMYVVHSDPLSKPDFVCEFCAQGFKKNESLKDHIAANHSQATSFLCPEDGCEKVFPTKMRVKIHVRQVHRSKVFHCTDPYCSKTFKNKNALNVHMAKKQGYRWLCSESGCDKYFTTKYVMIKHVKAMHRNLERSFVCDFPDCGKAYKFKDKLCMHQKCHQQDKLSCPVCSKTFGLQTSLARHMTIHESQKHFLCELCKLSFKRRYRLTAHLLQKHGIKMENFIS